MIDLSKDEFLRKYNISIETFEYAEISWQDLNEIYDDYCKKTEQLNKICKDFIKEFLDDNIKEKLHSICYRIKNAEHLVAKIIRKKCNNYNKYRSLDKVNYEKFVTDLIGIKGLLIYKEQWIAFHDYIVGKICNDEENYICDDYLEKYMNDTEAIYMAEPPKVHLREGDDKNCYETRLGCNNIWSKRNYRAVHYIIKYQNAYLEIQIRTLFEEGWSELDHHYRYPNFENNELLEQYSAMLNRLIGLADEMGTFFTRISAPDIKERREYALETALKKKVETVNVNADIQNTIKSGRDIIDLIILT